MLKMNTFDLGVVVISFIKPIYLKTEGGAPLKDLKNDNGK